VVRFLLSLFVVVSSLTPSLYAFDCDQAIAYLEKNAHRGSVLAAAKKVYSERLQSNRLPSHQSPDEDVFERAWVESLPSRSQRSIVLIEPAKDLGGDKGGPNSVQLVILDGKKMVFRPILSEDENPLAIMLPSKVRRTLAAARLAELLGSPTTTTADIVKIGNHFGALSEFVEGRILADPFDDRVLESDKMALHLVFEFLAGNRDDLLENFIISLNGDIKSIDHDLAFTNGIPTYRPLMPVGSMLPKSYPPNLANRLLEISRADLDSALGNDLTSHEIDHIQLRLEIVLEHMRSLS